MPLDPRDTTCHLARASFAAFLDGSIRRADQRLLRAHMTGCAECRAEFEGGIALTSDLARGARAAREQEERLQRRKHQRSMALAGAFTAWTAGSRGAHLRLMLVPAFLILLLTRGAQAPAAAERLRVEILQGEVLVGSDPLASASARVLRRGESCLTGADGSARVSLGETALVLFANTLVWVEEHQPPRLRLGGGRVDCAGALTLTTSLGVLECTDASASVGLSGGRLSIAVERGSVRFFDSLGERVLLAGDSLTRP